MANLPYIKGVRTRFRRTLEEEIDMARGLLVDDPEINVEEKLGNVAKCLEKLKSYSEKVGVQSEKLASALGEDDTEHIETILQEDCDLCSNAMDLYLNLKQYREYLVLEKEKRDIKFKQLEDSTTSQLLKLQGDMQNLLRAQMKQEEDTKKKEMEQMSSVKLPKIEMVSFSGDKTRWIEFWDSFQCAVHDNIRLTNVEKFSYLKTKLFGEARSSIAGLALSNENYPVAIKILLDRFGNPQEIVDIHYNQLISMQPATIKVSSLRFLLDKVERHLRSLEVLKQNVDQNVFVSIIRSKLPEEVLIQLETQKGVDNKWTVFTLSERLREYVVVRERSTKETKSFSSRYDSVRQNMLPNKSVHQRKHMNGNNNVKQFKSSSQALVSTGVSPRIFNKNQESWVRKCRYCQQNHWSDECNQYKTINERKDCIKGSCFKCLKGGHLFKDCKTSKACVYCGDMNVHHRSLCPKKFQLKESVTQIASEVDTPVEATDESGLMSMNEIVLMQTAFTEVRNPETTNTAPVRLMFDSGSYRSYITEALAKKLCLKSEGGRDIHVVTFGCKTPKRIRTKYARIDVKLKNGKHVQITVNIVPLISGELQRRPVNDLDAENIQDVINNVQLADAIPSKNETSSIEFLIGNDYYLDFVHCEKIELKEGLYLLASKLGWILSGRTRDLNETKNESSMLVLTYGSNINKSNAFATIDASLPATADIEDLWNVDSIGIVDKQAKGDDVIAMKQFRDTMQFDGKRYYVTWPWKEDEPQLPANKELAMGRLKTSLNRMKKKPDLLQKYDEVICDQLEKEVIEKVDANDYEGIVHYIPHHAVITPQKASTKMRVVYDASAKTKRENNSLNDCLYRGPVMLNDLCGMLIRFRMHPIALVADIEKAFLQIGLQKNQRDVTRFLWIKDINNPTTSIDNIQEYRFCRVPFGVVSSPFLLGATINYHLDSYKSDIADKIKDDIYVDNVITGTSSVLEAKVLYKEAKRMFSEGSMNLREWISNNEEVSAFFAPIDRADVESVTVLGHNWDNKKDTLSFKIPSFTDIPLVTKRIVLKRIASIFDPLGLVCPVLLCGKIFLQDLWRKQVGWDELLDEQDQRKWVCIVSALEDITKCCVPRCVSSSKFTDVEYRIVCFCDASQKAYSAAVYLHQTSQKDSTIDLIFAKTRLAPVKTVSIPRLELLAVVIGLRCLSFVRKQLIQPITHSYVFTDSQCVLHWIETQKPMSVFVKNRVNEIKEYTDVSLSYVPTKENPADLASRGTTMVKLLQSDLWWSGPKWLQNPCSDWPRFDFQLKLSDAALNHFESELCNTMGPNEIVMADLPQDVSYVDSKPLGIDISKFSSITKLLRVTALALRFIQKLQRRSCRQGSITSSELKDAERLWLRHVQLNGYREVFQDISANKRNNLQLQLGLYLDQSGLLRCKGRLENAGLSENARYPILLPKTERYTHLLIERSHKEMLHSGVSQTLSAIRLHYWIPHGRATVKTVLKSCRICRRYEGGSYKMPPMCSFPSSRVTEASPFSRVGLDYLGPLYIKTNGDEKKVWICLFTCLVIRAVHLELVSDMSTAEFLLCFRRFISQRGTPSEIISDNAKQFRSASTRLERIWNEIHHSHEVLSYVSNAGIRWSFNVELAPWMGGFYERLVGLVKRAMRKTIGRSLLTLVQLQTLIKEIESVINSRPLVYVGDDINSSIPITPAHFLTLNPKTGIPEIQIEKDRDYQPVESTAEKLLDIWKDGQRLLNMFWKIWRQEYLISLRERTQTNLKTGRVHSQFQVKLNDVVLVKDNAARGHWKFGKVSELMRSRDRCVRSAKVVISSGKEIIRPLNLLYPLEVSEQCSGENENLQKNSDKMVLVRTNNSDMDGLRPKRRAAQAARENIKQTINALNE